MKLREVTVESFRRFREPFTLSGLGDGLNLISEPNETGKSTLLEAMRAALFVRHRSREGEAFRPYGERTSPKVKLVFDMPDGRWTLQKTFNPGATVILTAPDGVRSQSDEAESRLQQMFGFAHGRSVASADESGALGLLWVEQAAAFAPDPPGAKARRTIEDVLGQEVGVVTGGKRAQSVQASVASAWRGFHTPTGLPAGKLAAARSAVTAAKARLATARAEHERLETLLTELERSRGELRRIEAELADPELQADIERWTVAHAGALTAAAQATMAEGNARERARLLRVAQEAQLQRGRDEEAVVTARGKVEGLRAGADAAEDALRSARARKEKAEAEFATALDSIRRLSTARGRL